MAVAVSTLVRNAITAGYNIVAGFRPLGACMIILAHRGWWLTPEEKNTRQAFARAFAAGYGVETDVRDMAGELVLAHDPPVAADTRRFSDFLDQYRAAGYPGGLAVNIKADGLQARLREQLDAYGVPNAFVFDMAVPDALGYLAQGFQTFTRHSEIEPVPPFAERAHGVWIDCFEGDWITADIVRRHRAAGLRVALVSPELHRRSHMAAWQQWRPLADVTDLMICTDFPDQADRYFKGGEAA